MAYSAWIQTSFGRRFYYDNLVPEQYFIDDIASGVSRVCRYNGQLKDTPELEDELYVVGQHSVYVYWFLERIPEAPRRALPWALLHDGLEGYCCDVTSPLKSMLPDYRKLEHAGETALRSAFNVPYDEEIHRWVKYADMQVLFAESQKMCAIPSDLWDNPASPEVSLDELDPEFYYWRPKKARAEYLRAYEEIKQYCKEA